MSIENIIIIIWAIQAAVCAGASYALAVEKGRPSVTYLFTGLLFGFIGFLYVGFLPMKRRDIHKKEQ